MSKWIELPCWDQLLMWWGKWFQQPWISFQNNAVCIMDCRMEVTVIEKAMIHQKFLGGYRSVVVQNFNLCLRHLIRIILICCNLSLLRRAMDAFLCWRKNVLEVIWHIPMYICLVFVSGQEWCFVQLGKHTKSLILPGYVGIWDIQNCMEQWFGSTNAILWELVLAGQWKSVFFFLFCHSARSQLWNALVAITWSTQFSSLRRMRSYSIPECR
jgi:hypothetical protein